MNDSLKKACELSMMRVVDAIPDDLQKPKLSQTAERKISEIEDSLVVKKRKPALKILIVAAVIVVLSVGVAASSDMGKYIVEKIGGHAEISVDEPYDGDLSEGITIGSLPFGYSLTESKGGDKFCSNYYTATNIFGADAGWFSVVKLTSDIVYSYDDGYYVNRDMVTHSDRSYIILSTTDSATEIQYQIVWNEGDCIYIISSFEVKEVKYPLWYRGITVEKMLEVADTIK